MKKGKYAKRRSIKPVAVLTALVLLVGCAIGGTVAWLTDETQQVVNTFTVGNIKIELKETDSKQDTDGNVNTNSYKMVPGNTIEKDPKVTVKGGSEACWLFVKVAESENLDEFITYVVDEATEENEDGWTAVPNHAGYYYREVATSTTDQNFAVIGNKGFDGKGNFVANKVLVKTTVTKEKMEDLKAQDATQPTLTFTAAAVQRANIADVAAAWAALPNDFKA